VAAVSLPYFDLHYWAISGRGAYVNGTPTRHSAATRLSQSIISIGDYATGTDAEVKNEQRISVTAALAAKVERVRMFGSAAHDLVWVADGRSDGTVILSNNSLDVAAGVLIARESGAVVTDGFGNSHTPRSAYTIAASPGVNNELSQCLRPLLHPAEEK
jgi:myo-inositol-1(or 4)-monophosphatase